MAGTPMSTIAAPLEGACATAGAVSTPVQTARCLRRGRARPLGVDELPGGGGGGRSVLSTPSENQHQTVRPGTTVVRTGPPLSSGRMA